MRFFKNRLFWKFFFSYFILILISLVVLMVLIRVLLPGIFDSYLGSMTRLFSRYGMDEAGHMGTGGHGLRMMGWSVLYTDLFEIFNQIILEAALFALLPSVVIALGVSAVMSHQFVRPLRQMARAADRIADGHYEERLPQAEHQLESQDELERLAARFNRMTAQLEQVEDMRQKLIGDVAHELRTPLTVIKGSLEGLMDGVLPTDASTYERIYRQVDRLDRLVNELQELNRIEEGVLELELGAVDLQKFLTNLIQTMQVNFTTKNVALNLDLPDGSLIALADQDRLDQVMFNLLSNALRSTPSGGRVSVKGERLAGAVRISVEDTGVGIAPEHLEKVFARFYRVDDSRSRQAGGSGIGLTVAKKLVEAMGGRIWAESAGLGQGAAFRFTLPLA
ncbi:MAG: HAMP domain-containing protein [Brevefilum sp.]|nr:HAMP domain-containing protein [Brevefilum sp.]